MKKHVVANDIKNWAEAWASGQSSADTLVSYLLGISLRLLDDNYTKRIEFVRSKWYLLKHDPTLEMMSDAEMMKELIFLGLRVAEEDIRHAEDAQDAYDYSEIPF
jgi:hypothetical protein